MRRYLPSLSLGAMPLDRIIPALARTFVRKCRLSFALLAMLTVAASSSLITNATATQWCKEGKTRLRKEQMLVLDCSPVPNYFIVPYLWSPVSVTIACPTSSFTVFTADSAEELETKFRAGESTWCGLASLTDPRTCWLQLSPFQQSYVAVRYTGSSRHGISECNSTSHASTSYEMLAAGALGIAVYFTSDYLSTNMAFRLSAGTLVFMSGSLAVLAFLLFRMLPHKRTVMATTAALGSTSTVVLRWLYGRWLPSLHQLTSNRWFAAYLAISAVVGATVTYLMDDARNPKVNNVIRTGLRLGGLILVYHSAWTQPHLAAAVVTLLILIVLLPILIRALDDANSRARTAAATTKDFLRSPLRHLTPLQLRHANAPAHISSPPTSPLVSPMASPRGASKGGIRRFWGGAGTHRQGEVAGSPQLPSGRTTPLHLRARPPNAWDLPRSPVDFEVWAAEAAARRRAAGIGPATAAVTSGGMDSPVRQPRQPQMATMRGGEPTEGGDGYEVDEQMSPLVRSGMIINSSTNRAIRINGPTYNSLIQRGYTADLQLGMLSPPSQPAGHVGSTASGAASGSSSRRRTPLR